MAVSAHAQLRTTTTVEFFPKKDRYARGEVLTATYTVKFVLPSGQTFPCTGAPIQIGDWWDTGWTTTLNRYTNSAGQVSFNYRVPTNPNWDNIYIVGNTMLTSPLNSWVAKRIPIGR